MANKYAHHSKQADAERSLYRKIHNKGFAVCSKKRAFDSEEAAQDFLSRKGYKGKQYKCDHCLKWHNTTKGCE